MASASRTNAAQLNIRSRYARERAAELARATGMTTTKVVEEALRAFAPAPSAAIPAGLERRGRLLVLPATGRTVSLAEAEAALADVRVRTAD